MAECSKIFSKVFMKFELQSAKILFSMEDNFTEVFKLFAGIIFDRSSAPCVTI